MYQSKVDLIKQYRHASVTEDLSTIEELKLEVFIDIRDVLYRLHETYTWVQREED